MITVGQVMDVILLGKGGKRTGETRPVKVLQILYLFSPKDAIRSVEIVTVDDLPVRRAWVLPRYLLAREEKAARGPDFKGDESVQKQRS